MDPKMTNAKQETKQIILRPNLIVTLMVMMINCDSVAGDGNNIKMMTFSFQNMF